MTSEQTIQRICRLTREKRAKCQTAENTTWPFLVGGFNPFEKLCSSMGSSPQGSGWKITNVWNQNQICLFETPSHLVVGEMVKWNHLVDVLLVFLLISPSQAKWPPMRFPSRIQTPWLRGGWKRVPKTTKKTAEKCGETMQDTKL